MAKVTRYETWVVRIPYEEGRFGTHVVLRLTDSDGRQGVGYVSNLTPWAVKAQHAAVEAFAERVLGRDPMAVEAINADLLRTGTRPQFGGLARSAVSVVDIAVWDLKAKALGQPLYRLLGAQDNRVTAYASWNLWWQYDIQTLVRHAEEHVGRGFRQMKYRMGGVQTLEEAVERTRALREAVGPDVDLLVDINWSWTVDKVIRIGRALEPFGLYWIEDPIPADDYEGLAQINRALQTRICAGETYHEPQQFRSLLDRRGADCVMIDLEVGGVTQWLKVAHLVEAYGLPVASHTCTEVSAHLVAAAANGLTVEYLPWAQPIFARTAAVQEGKLVLSEAPGLGLDLDEAALERFRLDS
ncbi:MAG TPA: mandelate racemase/muconate lactonizing enzyme family protein [Dehalococcoidia bacterium]|nr:mandelate racemase/muconate lactonizing enzyme family protein [Dehalococcoidia bacterium]